MSTIKAPEGKRYIVSSVGSALSFGTVIDSNGIEYDENHGRDMDFMEVGEGESLFRADIGEGISSYSIELSDRPVYTGEGPAQDPFIVACPVGTGYRWSASTVEGYSMNGSEGYSMNESLSGEGSVTEEGTVLSLVPRLAPYGMNVSVDGNIASLKIYVNGSIIENMEGVSVGNTLFRVVYGDHIHIEATPSEGYSMDPYEEDIIAGPGKERNLHLSASRIPDTVVPVPLAFLIEGEMSSTPFVGKKILTEGLVFCVLYGDGSTKEITEVSADRDRWGKSVGEQSVVFSCTIDGVHLESILNTYVFPIEEKDSYGNIWLMDGNYIIQGMGTLSSNEADIPYAANGMYPYALRGQKGIRKLHITRYLASIPEGAFMDCSDLVEVVFDRKSSISIGESAFSGCSSLSVLDFLSMGKNFSNCDIGDNAWDGCTGLDCVRLTRDNFSSSLFSCDLSFDEDGTPSCKGILGGPSLKWRIEGRGKSIMEKGTVIGHPMIWKVFSDDDKGQRKESVRYSAMLGEKTSIYEGNLSMWDKGDFVRGCTDSVMSRGWDFRNGRYLYEITRGEGNSISVHIDIEGLDSEIFDRVEESGYRFGVFNTLGGSSIGTRNLCDIVYNRDVVMDDGNIVRSLDLMRPLLK